MTKLFRFCFWVGIGLILALSPHSRVRAEGGVLSGVDFEVLVERLDSARGLKAIFLDTVSPLVGVPAAGFWEVASVEMRLAKIDSQAVNFDFQVIMLGANNGAMAKSYRADFGVPIRTPELIGNNGWRYRVTLKAIDSFEQDTSGCGFPLTTGAGMSVQPTATFRLYAPEGTLAAHSLSALGDQCEEGLKYFQRLISFRSSFQGNVNIVPCESPYVLWPHGELVAVDPSRGAIWMQYAVDRNGFDHTAVNLLMMLHHNGYSPHPLVSGIARFDSMDEWQIAQLQKKGQPVADVREYLTDWVAHDSEEMREAGSSFLRFLVLRSTIDSMRQFMRAADEFDLAGQIGTFYHTPFDTLVQEWKSYLDTVHFVPRQLAIFSDRAANRFQFTDARHLMEQAGAGSVTSKDTNYVREKLSALCFAAGDFVGASAYELSADTLSLAGATFAFLAGDSLLATQIYTKSLAKNSHDNGARFGLANMALSCGRVSEALSRLDSIVSDPSSPLAQIESRALLGMYLPRSKGKRSAEADSFLIDARAWYEKSLQNTESSPSMYVWYGLTLVGLGEFDLADKALTTATVLEVRPFYRAMALLWLGRVHDLQGHRDMAKMYYNEVLALPVAWYQRRDAELALTTPFRL